MQTSGQFSPVRPVNPAAEVGAPKHLKQPPPTGPAVSGVCQACGTEGLVLVGTVITCSNLACPRPDANALLLSETLIVHLVEISPDGTFSIQHPLIERLDGRLFVCDLHITLAGLSEAPAAPGLYSAGTNEADQIVLSLMEPTQG